MKLDKIKPILEEKGMSQTWLAEQLGKGHGMLMRMHAIGFSLA